MSLIQFFAVKDDLVPMLEMVESKGPLKYIRTGNFLYREFKESRFDTGLAISELGMATADQGIACDAYLVCEPDRPIELRRFTAYDGRERVCVDQLVNPDTVVFTPAGVWNAHVLLNASVGTASNSSASQALMKRFRAAIRRIFSKVRAFYVGPKALALLESGKRLAGAVQSPRELDLTINS